MGGGDSGQEATEYVGLRIQSSLKAITIPLGWGTFKVGCNLLDYLDFTATKGSAGGKGGIGSGATTYDYHATLILGICQGPIAGVRTVYKDQSTYTDGATTAIAQAGLTALFTGAIGQAPWAYLTASHPDHAIGYSGVAYAAAENYDLNGSATSPNHNFEVQGAVRATVDGALIDDANPADIVADLLPRVPQWPAGAIGDLTSYRSYCQAAGLFLSPVADEGRQASDLLSEILQASNSDCCWSEGLLKITPYGDAPIGGNGASWSPDLTPAYALDWGDIVPNSKGEDPIQWDFSRGKDAYNAVQVEYLDRTQQYAADTVPAVDQANVNTYGLRRGDPVSLRSICLQSVAATVAQLMVQRSANVRRTAEFLLPESFGLLDPMDLVTLPLRNGGTRLMQLTELDEQEDGAIRCKAEEVLVGAASAPTYARQSGQGVIADANADPGSVSPPVLINPPAGLVGATLGVAAASGGVETTTGGYEVWAAVAGTSPNWGGCQVWASLDGETYSQVGTIRQAARFGVSTADLPAHADPDAVDTLALDLTASGGALVPVSQTDADAYATLSLIGGEAIAYRDATLTSAGHYTLGYLRRGGYGTAIADHPAGSAFVRIDNAVFRYGYSAAQAGQTLHLKFPSFNVYGGALQTLDQATAYTMTLTPNTASAFVEVEAASIVGQAPAATDATIEPGATRNSLAAATLTVAGPAPSGGTADAAWHEVGAEPFTILAGGSWVLTLGFTAAVTGSPGALDWRVVVRDGSGDVLQTLASGSVAAGPAAPLAMTAVPNTAAAGAVYLAFQVACTTYPASTAGAVTAVQMSALYLK